MYGAAACIYAANSTRNPVSVLWVEIVDGVPNLIPENPTDANTTKQNSVKKILI